MTIKYLKMYNKYKQYGLESKLIQPYIFSKLSKVQQDTYLREMEELWKDLTSGMGNRIRDRNIPYLKDVWGF